MGFDNHYPNRKDWRKPFYKAKAVSHHCRNHGKCWWCKAGRNHRHQRQSKRIEAILNDY